MSLPKSTWCSPSNPQGTCSPEFSQNKEVCKPMDFDTLATYKGIQKAVNVLLKQDNKATISVDGRIGPETVAAVNVYSSTPFRDCNEMAKVAPETLAELQKLSIKGSGRAITKPGVSKAGFPFLPALLIFGALGAYVYYEGQKGKRKSKSKSKSKRKPARRKS